MDVSDLARHSARDVIVERYPERGFNARMTDMQAALGLCQLEVLDEILDGAARLAERYTRATGRVAAVEAPYEPDYATRTWQSYAVRVGPGAADRPRRADASAAGGRHARRAVGSWRSTTSRHTPGFHRRLSDTPRRPRATSLMLPLFPDLTERQQDYVLERLSAHVLAIAA